MPNRIHSHVESACMRYVCYCGVYTLCHCAHVTVLYTQLLCVTMVCHCAMCSVSRCPHLNACCSSVQSVSLGRRSSITLERRSAQLSLIFFFNSSAHSVQGLNVCTQSQGHLTAKLLLILLLLLLLRTSDYFYRLLKVLSPAAAGKPNIALIIVFVLPLISYSTM